MNGYAASSKSDAVRTLLFLAPFLLAIVFFLVRLGFIMTAGFTFLHRHGRTPAVLPQSAALGQNGHSPYGKLNGHCTESHEAAGGARAAAGTHRAAGAGIRRCGRDEGVFQLHRSDGASQLFVW